MPRLNLTVDRLALGGDGVARAEGRVIFIPHAAPGDRLEVEIAETHRNFSTARIVRVLEASADRIEPPCPYHHSRRNSEGGVWREGALPPAARRPPPFCGGCSWQHLDYAAQLRIKAGILRETLERIAGQRRARVLPALGMADPWRYRNKVQQPVGWDPVLRRLISGFYAEGTHAIVPIDDCLVQPELSVRILRHVQQWLAQIGARAYDARRHTGWIRHLFVRTTSPKARPPRSSAATGRGGEDDESRALLVLVTRTDEFPQQAGMASTLIQEFPELAGILQNVNPARTNVILGREWRRIAGRDFIEERLGPLRFRLCASSFFQINNAQAEVLFNVVRDLAGEGERLLDLYSGVGTIALWLAGRFREVGGIEENRAAVEDARRNAELNGIENARFQAMSAEAFLSRAAEAAGGGGLTVVLDPPRAGCARAVLEGLARLAPGRIVYVSCDPGTFARDLAHLGACGYRVRVVQPVDLFPHTPHIEAVAMLERDPTPPPVPPKR